MSLRDRIRRRAIPRAVVALSTVRAPARLAASLRRARGARGRVKLFIAFDDPQSAVALLGLRERLEGRSVDLEVVAVVERGIEDDPAVEAKRGYAVADASRLALRDGRTFLRTEPLGAGEVAFLAAWTAAIGDLETRAAFAAAAVRCLWLETSGELPRERCLAIWSEIAGGEPPADEAGEPVARNEATMGRRGLYDTPVASFGGEWFFAHERLEQIGLSLDRLGWAAAG